MMKGILTLLIIFLSIDIFACKCDDPTIKGSFESADFVFIGDVYDINQTYKTGYWNVENSLSKVKIENIYKSLIEDFKSKEVTFFGQQFNSCDVIFTKKGKYLIFAYIDPDTSFFYSSLCLATKPINELTETDYNLLEKLKSNYIKTISEQQDNNQQTFSLELRTPDKIINELKFENKQLSEQHQKQKTYFLVVAGILIVMIIFLIVYRRK